MAIRFDPAEEMLSNFDLLKEDARTKFNDNKRGNGARGSIFYKCVKIWKAVKKTFINGTHSGVEELSCFDRPYDRSNQAIEGSNKDKNRRIKKIAKGGRVTFDAWLQLSRSLEKNTHNRLHQLNKQRDWRTKNRNLVAKDKAFATIFKQYRTKAISHGNAPVNRYPIRAQKPHWRISLWVIGVPPRYLGVKGTYIRTLKKNKKLCLFPTILPLMGL